MKPLIQYLGWWKTFQHVEKLKLIISRQGGVRR